MNNLQNIFEISKLQNLVFFFRLLGVLVIRDLKVHYRGAIFGIFWLFIVPIILLVVYGIIFSGVLGVMPNRSASVGAGIVSIYLGLSLYWFGAESISRSLGIISANEVLFKKTMFPQWIIVLVPVSIGAINYIVSCFLIALVGGGLSGIHQSGLLLVPVIVFPFVLFIIGFSYAISILSIFIRDLRHVIPVILTIFMFISPIFYGADRVPEKFQLLFDLNPLAHTLGMLRSVVLDGEPVQFLLWIKMLLAGLAVFSGGVVIFRRLSRGLVDAL